MILRHLPEGWSSILDVGGGPDGYARWLSDLGHDVTLLDPVPLHVEQARGAGVRAERGDARSLAVPSASVDVVLLMGPLYHLLGRADRLRALAEARRVLRPGGVLFAVAISRFAALLDVVVRADRAHEEDIARVVETAVATGSCAVAPRGCSPRPISTGRASCARRSPRQAS